MKVWLLAALMVAAPVAAAQATEAKPLEGDLEVWFDQIRWNGQDESWTYLDYDGSVNNLRFGATYQNGRFSGQTYESSSAYLTWLVNGFVGPGLGVSVDKDGTYFEGGLQFETVLGKTKVDGYVVTDLENVGSYVAAGLGTKTDLADKIGLWSSTSIRSIDGGDTNWRFDGGIRYEVTDTVFTKVGVIVGETSQEKLSGATLALGVKF